MNRLELYPPPDISPKLFLCIHQIYHDTSDHDLTLQQKAAAIFQFSFLDTLYATLMCILDNWCVFCGMLLCVHCLLFVLSLTRCCFLILETLLFAVSINLWKLMKVSNCKVMLLWGIAHYSWSNLILRN